MNKNRFFPMASAVAGMLLMTASCSDENKYESRLPVFDHVSVSPSTAAPGDTISATLHFAYEGSYIKGTYEWNVSNPENGTIATEKVEAAVVKEKTFRIAIPEVATEGTYTLRVKPCMMAAYAGASIYLDYNSMGEVSTQLTIAADNQPEE